ncbi:hypothetical protein L7F22_048283 [Adiantum nelumboides]|nr:hypothetical protein [Adiantum nelumboides]
MEEGGPKGLRVEGTTRIRVQRREANKEGGKEEDGVFTGREEQQPQHKEEKEEKEEGEKEEILALQGVQVRADAKLKMDIFLSHKDHHACHACPTCPDCAFAGSFLILPAARRASPSMSSEHPSPPLVSSNHRVGISDVLRELRIHEDDSFSLAIVPSSLPPGTPFSINSISLQHE